LAKANGNGDQQYIYANFERNIIYQNILKLATYKPRLPRCQRTKLHLVENQLFLGGHY